MVYLTTALGFTGVLVALTVLLILAGRYLINYGVCTVDINDGEKPLQVQGGQTLLATLISQKVFLPSACGGKGSCGYCKVTVLRGGGPLLPTETPYLNARERKSGVRLACQVKVRSDINIRVPEDLLNVKQYRARLSKAFTRTPDIREVNFDLLGDEQITYRPGQYVQVLAPVPGGDVFRAYSISSPAYEHHGVQLIVRLVPGGIASTYIHGLAEGAEITLTGPYGEFRLSEDPDTEIVCVGGGCGMAPMRNIIYSLYSRWPGRTCWLFFGCRTTRDIFYLDEFRELSRKHPSFKVVYALSDPLAPNERWDGETGFIHLAVDKMLTPNVRRQAFLCGPPPMIDAVTTVLRSKGLTDSDVFYDKF